MLVNKKTVVKNTLSKNTEHKIEMPADTPCVFPFKISGQMYDDCESFEIFQNEERSSKVKYCATTNNFDVHRRYKPCYQQLPDQQYLG